MRRRTLYLLLFFFIILITIALSSIGPNERTLGHHVRLVYLHGVWVWTALLGFLLAAVFGLVGLLSKKLHHHAWSIAFSRASTFFWVTYLPLSLWTMQANWNGIFLQEPRWKVSFDFAIVALLIQLAIVLLNNPQWGSFLNIAFFSTLGWTLIHTEQIMHPGSPIFASGSIRIQGFFVVLLLLVLAGEWFLTYWFRTFNFEPQ
jgi:hypothetical protein